MLTTLLAMCAVSAAEPSPEADAPDTATDTRIKETVTQYSGELRYCYEVALKQIPGTAGRIVLAWHLNEGTVTELGVVSDTTDHPDLAVCLMKKIQTWTFDEAISGPASWPFVFRANQGGLAQKPTSPPRERDEAPGASAPVGVKEVVERREKSVIGCYRHYAFQDPELSGHILLEWRVESGRAWDVTAVANTTESPGLASCISKKVERWRFPDTPDGPAAWPFQFVAD